MDKLSDTLDRAEDDILTPTLSDEAPEAAAGTLMTLAAAVDGRTVAYYTITLPCNGQNCGAVLI